MTVFPERNQRSAGSVVEKREYKQNKPEIAGESESQSRHSLTPTYSTLPLLANPTCKLISMPAPAQISLN